MFFSFTPNPCFERTILIDGFAAGGSFRIAPNKVVVSAGGKGINAARVCAHFGQPALIMAMIGKQQLNYFSSLLNTPNLRKELLEAQLETRTCINLVHSDSVNFSKTEILEVGQSPTLAEGTKILETWRDLLPQCELASIGGSYPLSRQSGWKLHGAVMCQMAAQAGKKLIYDGKGEEFKRAVNSDCPPWAIKPNLEEAAGLWERPIESPAEERGAIRHFLNRGVEVVLLSCGSRGMYVGHNRQIEFFHAPPIEEISAVGSGDSLVGAFAAKYMETGDVFEAARWGVAAGSANAAKFEAATVTLEETAQLLPQVRRHLTEISLQVN